MSTTEIPGPERGGQSPLANPSKPPEQEARSAFQAALEQSERIKSKLRAMLGEVNDAANLLKTAEREYRATTKEIEAVRAKLREIQSLEI